MKRLVMTALTAAVLAVSGVQVSGSVAQAQVPSSTNVTIQNFAFSPAAITVAKGTTVTWTNRDSTAHTVTVDSGNGPKSSQLQKDQTYSFKFDQAGTAAYHCSIHPYMKASVTVTETATPSPAQKAPSPTSTPPPASGRTTTPPTPNSSMGSMGSEVPNVAAGSVTAGAGSTAGLQHGNLLAGGVALIVLAGAILTSRRRLPFKK
jgi:plastocyanin